MLRRFLLLTLVVGCGARSPLEDDSLPPGADTDASANDGGSLDGTTGEGGEVLSSTVLAPRPIAPLSTSTTTTQQPTFRWALASGTDGARVELCADRNCNVMESSFDCAKSSCAPPTPLTHGLHFYRLRGRSGAVLGDAVSATWEIFIPRQSTPHDTSWGAFPDFNGDGYCDVVITGFQSSYLSFFPGSAGGVQTTTRSDLLEPSPYGSINLATAGDLDGDGYGDLAITTISGSQPGHLFIYRGGPKAFGAADKPDLTLPFAFNTTVAGAGDVNQDGYADLLISEGFNSATDSGHIYIYFGSPSGPAATPSITLDGDNPGATFGGPVAGVGDLDGDGFADVVGIAGGTLLIFRGAAQGPSDATRTKLPLFGAPFGGQPVLSATPGDVNGDGLADVVIGNDSFTKLGIFGAVVLYGGTDFSSASTLTTPPGMDMRGGEVAFAGDINGDGYDDLVAGAPGSFVPSTATGGLVFWGSPKGVSDAARSTFALSSEANHGVAMAGAGDLDRDGYLDVLLNAAVGGGRVYAFKGGANGISQNGTTLFPKQGEWGSHASMR